MSHRCSTCGAELRESAQACPACDSGVAVERVPSRPVASRPEKNLEDNVAAVVGYLTFVPALVLLLTDRYRERRFVRFHSYQSMYLSLVGFAVTFFLILAWFAAAIINRLWLTWTVDSIIAAGSVVFLAVWVLCVTKAYRLKEYRLPVLGEIAAQKVESSE